MRRGLANKFRFPIFSPLTSRNSTGVPKISGCSIKKWGRLINESFPSFDRKYTQIFPQFQKREHVWGSGVRMCYEKGVLCNGKGEEMARTFVFRTFRSSFLNYDTKSERGNFLAMTTNVFLMRM